MSTTRDDLPCFHGHGDIRALLRSHDWPASPLGDPRSWPQELVTVVDLMLQARYPAVVVWGDENVMLYNDAYAPLLGPRHPSSLGRPFRDVWPEIWPEIEPIVKAAMDGIPAYFEDVPVMVAPNGFPERRWFTSSYSPVRDREGRVLGMFNAGFETTRRMLDERRLAFQLEVADRLRLLSSAGEIVAAASEMLGRELDVARVVFCEIDGSGGSYFVRRDWTAAGAASMAGATLRLDDFGPGLVARLRAGHAVAVDDIAADPLTAGHAANYAALGVRAKLALPLLKGDRLAIVLGLHCAETRHWQDAEVGLAQDVAERTRLAIQAVWAETALRASEERYRALFNQMDSGCCVVQLVFDELQRPVDYRYVDINPMFERHTGLDQALGKTIRELQPDIEAFWIDTYGRVALTGAEVRFEHYSPSLRRWFDVNAFRLGQPDAHQVAIVFRDATAAKQIEADMRRMAAEASEENRRKSEFLAVLAHELRNPLAPIRTGLELMRMRGDSPDTVRRVREMIERQTTQMTHLINDLLDMARVTSGKIEIRKQPVDLNVIVAGALETCLPAIEGAHHELALQLHAEPLVLDADPTRIAQVVGNLLTNAAKYTPPGGNLRLAVERDGGSAIVSVTDNGIGIPPESQASVFDMFSQVGRNMGHAQGGLGIGLALVRQLVGLHGGSISVSSEGVGLGSTFIVRLPLGNKPLEDGEHVALEPRRDAQRAHRRLRILVADDNTDAAQSLAALLEEYGHAVSTAHDGVQALGLARDVRPEVAFLDLGMPGMSGYEVARSLRLIDGLARIRIVAVTGWGTPEDRARTAQAGFDGHFTKPVAPAALNALLEGVE